MGDWARLAHRRWYISSFVWNTLGAEGRQRESERVPSVHHLPGVWYPPAERKGFLFWQMD